MIKQEWNHIYSY